jgi:rhamnogalacturonan endolyase
MMVADADGDGAQEIIYGASTIASDGTAKCSTGFGHGDALHVGVFVPTRTGIQVFMPHEDGTQPSYDVHDAFTCEVIVRGPVTGNDNGRAAADFVSPTDVATCFQPRS